VLGEEEAALVRRVAGGDRDAFRILVMEHQGPLGAYAQRMLGERSAAQDVVQETLLRLWSRAGSFRPEAARLSTWLHNIAHNLCIDRFRGDSRMRFGEDAEDSSAAPDPTLTEEQRREGQRLRGAIAALPERQRSALLLCHYQGLSNRDVARILEISVDALESLLRRARRRLKQSLGDDHAA